MCLSGGQHSRQNDSFVLKEKGELTCNTWKEGMTEGGLLQDAGPMPKVMLCAQKHQSFGLLESQVQGQEQWKPG